MNQSTTDTATGTLGLFQKSGIIISTFSFIVSCIIGLGLLIGGLYLLFKKYKQTANIAADIINASCPFNSQNRTYDCNLTIEFTPPNSNKVTTSIIVSSGTFYSNGQTIKVFYDPNNPTDVSVTGNLRFLGIILIIIALAIVGISYFWLYASKKSPIIATGVTAAEGLSLLSGGRLGRSFI